MPTVSNQITVARPAKATDRVAMVDTLVAAFYPDPVFEWILPDPKIRAAAIPAWFEVWADAYLAQGEAVVIGDVEGAALWARPGTDAMAGDHGGAFEALVGELAVEAVERMAILDALLEATHPHDVPHWYLHLLGTHPGHQGKGNGSMLLRRILDLADRRGEHAYLDATTARNKALYERHGFVCIAESRLPDGPPLYAMWREPKG